MPQATNEASSLTERGSRSVSPTQAATAMFRLVTHDTIKKDPVDGPKIVQMMDAIVGYLKPNNFDRERWGIATLAFSWYRDTQGGPEVTLVVDAGSFVSFTWEKAGNKITIIIQYCTDTDDEPKATIMWRFRNEHSPEIVNEALADKE